MSPNSRLAAANKVFQASAKLAEKRASRLQGLRRPDSRIFSSVSSATAKFVTSTQESAHKFRAKTISFLGGKQRANIVFGVTGGLLLAGLHSATGSQNEFYDYRFKLQKDPDDLASFYGGEEFMELFCIFPFVGQIMMRSGYFDDEGNVITQGIPGTMKVSMVFSEETSEASGKTDWFNKRERFRNTLFGFTMWDMVCNFGFRTLEDGTLEGYHVGEYFHGNLPVVSQVMKLVFKIHSRWLAWSTEHHLNHYAFDAEEDWEEEMEIESRHNMPLFLLQNYAWKDLMGMFFGVEVGTKEDKEASFLLQRRPSLVSMVEDAEDMKEEEEDEEIDQAALLRKKEADKLLPFQRRGSMVQIAADIAADRAAVKQLLARDTSGEDTDLVLARNATEGGAALARNTTEGKGNFYGLATEGAKARLLERRQSMSNMAVPAADLQRRESSAPMNIPMDQLKGGVVAVAAEQTEEEHVVAAVDVARVEKEDAEAPVVMEATVDVAATTIDDGAGKTIHEDASAVPVEKKVAIPTAEEPVLSEASETISTPDVAVAAEAAPERVADPVVAVASVVTPAEETPVAVATDAAKKTNSEAAPQEDSIPVAAVSESTPNSAIAAVVAEVPAAQPLAAGQQEIVAPTTGVPADASNEVAAAAVAVAEIPAARPMARAMPPLMEEQTPQTLQAAKQHYDANTERNLLESKIAHLEASIEKKESALLKDKVARLEAIIEGMQQSRV